MFSDEIKINLSEMYLSDGINIKIALEKLFLSYQRTVLYLRLKI
jgi:hypothetical protein